MDDMSMSELFEAAGIPLLRSDDIERDLRSQVAAVADGVDDPELDSKIFDDMVSGGDIQEAVADDDAPTPDMDSGVIADDFKDDTELPIMPKVADANQDNHDRATANTRVQATIGYSEHTMRDMVWGGIIDTSRSFEMIHTTGD